MADVLLTHSYHLAYDPKQVRKMQPYAPLGTLYAASALRAQGSRSRCSTPCLQDPIRSFANALQQHRPRIVAIYEDDFNFLSKMCLTRMRELAWQIDSRRRRTRSHRHRARLRRDRSGGQNTFAAESISFLRAKPNRAWSSLCSAPLAECATSRYPGAGLSRWRRRPWCKARSEA